MKVLFIVPANKVSDTLHYSGFIKNEIQVLEKHGIKPIIYFFTGRLSIKELLVARKELKALIKKNEPDIIHVEYGSITGFLAAISNLSTPWVITFGGSDLLGHPKVKGVKLYWKVRDILGKWMSFYAASKANAVICVSHNLKVQLPSSYQSKVTVIPRGINCDIFKVVNKEEARKKLNWSNKKKVVLFCQSRANADVKNFPLAKKTICVLEKQHGLKAELVKMMNLSIDEIVLYLNAADVFLMTSLHEGSPNIIKESMACNLPIVSVPCGDVKERLSETKPSIVVEYDEYKLAQGLSEVFATNLRSNGREQLLKEKIDADSIAKKISDIYNIIQ